MGRGTAHLFDTLHSSFGNSEFVIPCHAVTETRVDPEPEWLPILRAQLEQRRDPWVLLEGQAMVEAALAGWWEVPGVVVAEGHAWQAPLWSGLELIHLPAVALEAMGDPARHGGVIGLAKLPKETAEVAAFVKSLEPDALLVVCPKAGDAASLGDLVRLAVMADAAGVLIGAEGASPFELEAVAASVGTVFKVPVKVADAGLILRCLMAGKVYLLGLGDQDETRVEASEGRQALVVPGEKGLDGFWRKACDGLVMVPVEEALRLLAGES